MKQITETNRLRILQTMSDQLHETVAQEERSVTIRLGTITCPCGSTRGILHMYHCLYCGIWYCTPCAEMHFGKTVQQYRREVEYIDG